ncbi:hypothetical protein ACVWZV_005299 [Bradyrhizobium sp. GM5.1]
MLSTNRTTSIGERSSSFRIILVRWTLAVTSLTPSLAAICLATRPSAHQQHDLPLPRRQRLDALARFAHAIFAFEPPAVALDAVPDRVEDLLFAKGFWKKLDCAALHGLDRDADVGMAADEDDRDKHARLGEPALKLEAGRRRAGKADVEHKA